MHFHALIFPKTPAQQRNMQLITVVLHVPGVVILQAPESVSYHFLPTNWIEVEDGYALFYNQSVKRA